LPEPRVVRWRIDREAGTVAPEEPPAALRGLAWPLDPMIGCFGVAPAGGQAISTATSGEHGGNMDYRGFREGVTAYFPVSVPGALFHLGDGHAVQGDGEIVGTGVETSFEMTFTVRVEKGRRLGWPRGENAEEIFAVGNARPLDQALQHATSEMLRWLEAEYGLDAEAASLLLGQAVRYDVGNVYDPAYTVVCRLAKRWLT
jgi:acetamidase/formamidase